MARPRRETARRRASATPPAPQAIPRACSTAIARRPCIAGLALFADGIAMREARRLPAGGADVPCLCLGLSLCCADGRRRAGVGHIARSTPLALVELVEVAQVTMATAVPTVWLCFLDHLGGHPQAVRASSSLRRRRSACAAIGQSFIDGFGAARHRGDALLGHDGDLPLGLTNVARFRSRILVKRRAHRTAQGLPIPAAGSGKCSMRRRAVAATASHRANCRISSPWSGGVLFRRPGRPGLPRTASSLVVEDGRTWLKTLDVHRDHRPAWLCRDCVDRAKDLIKSGSEWISSQSARATDRRTIPTCAGRGDRQAGPGNGEASPVIWSCCDPSAAEPRERFAREYRAGLSR